MARVLVVDDAAFMRENIKRVLINGGHEIAGEAVDGNDAVRKFHELGPDIVTMDITMPNLDGLEALAQIREADPESRVVMCSAMGQQSMVVDAIHKGAKDFIVKPFQPERVLDAIAAGLER